MSSLIEKWSPVTSDFGLIQAPLDDVLSELFRWHTSIGIEYARSEISSSLSAAFESLLPLAHNKLRTLFFATHTDWVVFYQNGIDGSDPFPAMSYLAKKMKVLAMRVCSTPDKATYPANIWEVYAPESLGGKAPLGYRRTIAAANDGGRWVFHESGERYPFEQIERYSERRKKDRFTKEMFSEYLKHFNIQLFSDDFHRIDSSTPAIRLQQLTKVWHTPEYTLEQVVAGVPWKKRL